ncbi:MAG TPA: PEGA domain-containing protein [Myxococcales bacterium]|jgi:hypothetical protein
MRRLLAVSLCALLVPAFAFAEGIKVAVAPFAPLTGDVPVRAGGKGAMLLAGELKNVGTVTPVEIGLEANEVAGKALESARQAVNVAQAAEKKRKYGQAASAYRAAITSYDAGASLLLDPTELSDAHAALGIVLYLTGDDVGGAKELSNAVSLTPTRAFAGEATSPLFTATCKKIREKVMSGGKASLKVESTPPGAMVFFDGQEMGRTPLSIKDIPPGKHLWRVLMPTSDPIGGAITLASGAKEKVAAALGGTAPVSQLIAAMIGNKLDDKVLAHAKATTAAAGADLLVFGAFFARGQDLVLETFLYSPAKHAAARLPQKVFDTEMLSAGMELFKVAGEIGGRTEELGAAEKVGTKISAEAPPFASAELTELAYALPGEKGLDKSDDRGPRRPVDPNKNIKNLRPRDK